MADKPWHLETEILHRGEEKWRTHGAVTLPIFQSSTFEQGDETDYNEIRYARISNTPNHHLLHEKLAALEGAEGALVTSSGMSAITTTLLTLLGGGGHMLVQSSLYGGTLSFINHDLHRFGIAYDFIDADRPESWAAKLRPETRLIYMEGTTNPLLEIGDLEAGVRFARAHKLLAVIDNTFPSPVNFRPIPFGFDVVLHSATKYLNGHSDLICGAVIANRDLIGRIHANLNHLGGSLDPHACFLLQRGLKTLTLRVERQNENALKLAKFLETHPAVARVIHPGLASHPHHERARKWFKGYGGMLSVELKGGVPAAEAACERLKLPLYAPSLGGVESLITRPAVSSHAGLSPEELKAARIPPALLRVSVGIEHIEDLIADFGRALDA